jgi:hypothetical protein
MADAAVLTPGLLRGEMLLEALSLISKGGRLVLTAVSPWNARSAACSRLPCDTTTVRVLRDTSRRTQNPTAAHLTP